MALDFSLLGQGPQFQNVLAAFQGGQQARKETDTRNALAMYDKDPEGAISALGRVDPLSAMKLRDDLTARKTAAAKKAVFQTEDPTARRTAAMGTGDPQIIEAVMKLDDTQRAAAKESAEAVGSVAYGLRTAVPYEQRKARIAEIAPALEASGWAPEKIAAFDPTDQNLDMVISQAQSVDKLIAQKQAEDKAKAEAADRAADNARADRLADNTIQTDAERLKNDRTRLGFEGRRVGMEGQRLAMARAETSGGGKAPSGYRYTANGALEFIPGGPADPATRGSTLKVVPAKAASGLAENRTSLSKIDRALDLVDKYPKGLGLANKLGDTIRQRTDPNGVDVRAAVADIGSQKLHDRSGASVTVSESPRLMPFIPKVDDTPETAAKKLRMLRYEYESMVNETEQLYSEDNGYRPVGAPVASAPRATPAQRPPLASIFGK